MPMAISVLVSVSVPSSPHLTLLTSTSTLDSSIIFCKLGTP